MLRIYIKYILNRQFLYIKILYYNVDKKRKNLKMALKQKNTNSINPFEQVLDASKAMANMDNLDKTCIVRRFKATKDPIEYAFNSFDNVPLRDLAIDFVTESLEDVLEFVSKVCKQKSSKE